ncbi:MAG: helix-turn-helix domain-containing protein [bacterium]
MDNNDEILTTDEAAKYLKVSTQTVLKLFKQGELPGQKVGRHHRFLRDDLRAFISGKKKDE